MVIMVAVNSIALQSVYMGFYFFILLQFSEFLLLSIIIWP